MSASRLEVAVGGDAHPLLGEAAPELGVEAKPRSAAGVEEPMHLPLAEKARIASVGTRPIVERR